MIPFCKPSITLKEKIAVWRQLSTGQLAQGETVKEFEKQFAWYIGSKYAVAVSSGTSALFLSLKYLGVTQGDKVAVPSITFTASASTIRHCMAVPAFCDIEFGTFCAEKESYERCIASAKTGVIVLLTGNIPSWNTKLYGNNIIYDSAHRIERDCYIGGLQTFSFHGTKNITTGFGGMIATDDEDTCIWLRQAREHGVKFKGERQCGYDVEFCGWKMNMNNIQAALGLAQLSRLDWMNKERNRCVSRYNANLGLSRTGNHLYPILIDDREEFIERMNDYGIQCSIHFEPLHKMMAYSDIETTESLHRSEYFGKHAVSLPLFPKLKNSQIDYICQMVQKTKLAV